MVALGSTHSLQRPAALSSPSSPSSPGPCPPLRPSGLTPHALTASRGRRSLAVRMGYTEDGPSVAVVGVTGAVGQEFLSVLKDRDFPYRSITMLASKRSAGQKMHFDGREYTVEELTDKSFAGQCCLLPPSPPLNPSLLTAHAH